MFTDAQKAALDTKLDASAVKSREQSGRKLSYIEGWHAIAEANRIFGFDAWNRKTIDIRCVSDGPRKIGRPPRERDGFGVSYIARVRVTVGDIVREGVGAGHGIDTDHGLAHESAIKEAETDAMKRALMTFGNPFGLALYDKSQANVGDASEPETKQASAADQRRGLEEIERELIDCRTDRDVVKLVDAWAEIAERSGWSQDYWNEARRRFAARRAAIKESEAAFPGDAPMPDAAARDATRNNPYVKAMRAG